MGLGTMSVLFSVLSPAATEYLHIVCTPQVFAKCRLISSMTFPLVNGGHTAVPSCAA